MTGIRKIFRDQPGITALLSLIAFVFCIFALTGCKGQSKPAPPAPAPTTKPAAEVAKTASVADGSTLYLAQAQFITKTDPDTGEPVPAPGPARLNIWTKTVDGWSEEVLEDPDSDVFHKAASFKPVQGEPGILTIGAREAFLKLWRRNADGKFEAEEMWNPTFGGKYDRLRDFEVADVNDDGLDEICIVTHDEGVIAVLQWQDGKYVPQELARRPNTFVHEMEVGDVDGDGIIEMFTTPSNPNKMDGTVQPGNIDMFKWDGTKYIQGKVDEMPARHAKEILCAAIDTGKRPVLFTALEGENLGGHGGGDTTRIRMYEFDTEGNISKSDIASLPGQLCRFLTMGDTDGDGHRELIASTHKNGIWRLDPPKNHGDAWKKTLVATGTSGFEHSTYLADLNGDGLDEIYVASDNQSQLRQYTWNGRGYSAEVIGQLKDDTITFNVVAE